MGSVHAYSVYCDTAAALAEVLNEHLLRHRLLQGVKRLGLAVSGGADSVALLHLLAPLCQEKGLSVTVLHANHGLREESAQEAEFVRALAASKGFACLSEELRLAGRCTDGASLEMAARSARHAFFARCCHRAELDAVATGHQADDVAETLLLRLARGAGCTGLSALRPRSPASPALTQAAGRPFSLLRPLLPISARALREWLSQRGLTWCEDASNQSCDIPRNRVRNCVLPQIERAWGDTFRASLCRSAEILRAEDALLEQLAEQRLKSLCAHGSLDIPRLNHLPEALRRRAVRRWLFAGGAPEDTGFESVSRLLAFCHEPEGASLQLARGAFAIIRQSRLCLSGPAPHERLEAVLPLQGQVAWGGLVIDTAPDRGVCAESHGVGAYPAVCSVALEALQHTPLSVRSRSPGDRLFPTGMTGSKKLQDVFVDEKIPAAKRDAIPIFVCGGEVVWVPGHRVSRHFLVPGPEAPSLRITVRQPDSER